MEWFSSDGDCGKFDCLVWIFGDLLLLLLLLLTARVTVVVVLGAGVGVFEWVLNCC